MAVRLCISFHLFDTGLNYYYTLWRDVYRSEYCGKHTLNLMCEKNAQNIMCDRQTHTHTYIYDHHSIIRSHSVCIVFWNSKTRYTREKHTRPILMHHVKIYIIFFVKNICIGGGETCDNHLFYSVNTVRNATELKIE